MNANYTPPENNENCLEKFGTDLTELAAKGKLDFSRIKIKPVPLAMLIVGLIGLAVMGENLVLL